MTKVLIGLGGNKDLSIDKDGDLCVSDSVGNSVFLGKATRKRMTQIQEMLERMKVFAEPE